MNFIIHLVEQCGSLVRKCEPLVQKFGLLIKKNYVLILSFLLPVVILETAYITRGIYPFGGRDILLIDLYHQYAPFVSDLQDKLRSFSSLLYSWTGGLGATYLPLIAYYLASPLNIISILFPKENLTEIILTLVLLKTGLAGACFAVYLKKVLNNKTDLSVTAFSLLYALSGHMMAYSWNIMWLDAIYLLPLIVLGLVRLIRDGKGVFFCIALGISLFSSFYMSIFICLFIAVYFPVCLFQYHDFKKPKILVKRTLQFSGFSLLSAGLASILLVPTFFALKLTSAAGETFPAGFKQYFDIFDYISRFFVITEPSIREGMPNLYCGIAVLILMPMYFFSRIVRLKEKLLYMGLLMLIFLSFNTDTLNFIWHGSHFPNQLPYRYSFIGIFVILTLSYTAFNKLDEFSGKQIGSFCSVAIGLIVLSQKINEKPPGHMILYISILFVVLYAAVLTSDGHFKLKKISYRPLIFLLVVFAEITLNTIVTADTIDRTEYYSTRNGYSSGTEAADIRNKIKEINASDKSFYRMEIYPPKTTNDPNLYNFRGLSIFSSTIPMKPVKTMQNFGFHSNGINSYKYEGSTALLDSLFGIKYIIRRNDEIEERLYKEIASTDEIKVYENLYALPLGFYAPNGVIDWKSNKTDPFKVQNEFIEKICGVSDIFVPLEQKQGTNTNMTYSGSWTKNYSYKRSNKDIKSIARVKIVPEKDMHVYLYHDISGSNIDNGFIMVGDKKINFNAIRSTMVNVGFCKAGTVVEFNLTIKNTALESGSFRLYSYGLNEEAFKNAISLIRKNSLTLVNFTDNSVEGVIEAEDEGIAFMTIPFDPGWKIRVDGLDVKPKAVDNGFLSFYLSAGSHYVELEFIPDKFNVGMWITLLSLFILILVCILPFIFGKREKNR
jgi:uncharacterized membrane protein YfhO